MPPTTFRNTSSCANERSGALVEHGEQQREPSSVESRGDALRRSESRLRGERLNLDEHRPRALEQRGDRAARRVARAIAHEELGRIRDRLESLLRHAKHADLVDAAEAILRRAQHAMIERALALEVQHRVDDVLERLRTGDAAALRDVPDDEHRGAALLGVAHQPRGAFAHLSDVARRALEIAREDRLNRVDDQHGGRGRRATSRESFRGSSR